MQKPRLFFFQDLKAVFSAEFLSGLFAFAYTLVSARFLGLERFGLFQSSMALYALLAFFNSPLLLVSVHCTAAASVEDRPKVIGELILTALLLSLIPLSILGIGSPLFFKWMDMPHIWLFLLIGLMLTFKTLLSVLYGAFQGQNTYSEYARMRLIEIGSVFIFGSLLVVLFRNSRAALSGYAIGMLLALVFSLKRHRYRLSIPGKILKQELGSIILILCCFCTIMLIDSLPVILSRARISKEEAGFFGALYNLRNVLMPFAFGVTMPLYSRIVSQNEEPSLFRHALFVVLGLGAGFLGVSLLFPAQVILLLYGNEFLGAASFMVPYGISLLLQMLVMVSMFHDIARKMFNPFFLLVPILAFFGMILMNTQTLLGFMQAQWVGWSSYLAAVWLLRRVQKFRLAAS